MKYSLPFVLIFILTAGSLSAQKFEYDFDFRVRFDNREYKSELSGDLTLFGLKAVPQAGISWGGNKLMGGVDFTRHFGAKNRNQPDPEIILYYAFDNQLNFTAFAGAFKRTEMSAYPRAFVSGSKVFYDPVLEGVLLRYYGARGEVELVCDWNSMISKTEYERFILYSQGRLSMGRFRVGYYAMMHHFAGSETDPGVVDNALLYPTVKCLFSLERPRPTDCGRVRNLGSFVSVGWLQAVQNDRENEGEFVFPGGFMAEVQLRWRAFGLFNTLYLGDDIMPYYHRYGKELYIGDPFFRTSEGIYNRLEVYWQPQLKHGVGLKVSTVHHYEGKKWNWQQLVTLSVDLNRKTFGR